MSGLKSYLEKKGIKFKDERLNCAIDLCALAPYGSKKMDFLIDHLTEETIEAINTKNHIYGVPTTNDNYIEVLFDDTMDPSYNGMVLFICILTNKECYTYGFRLSNFHSKMVSNFDVCSIDRHLLMFGKDGELYSKKLLSNETVYFTVGENYKNVISTKFGTPKVIKRKDMKLDCEGVFGEFREKLKDRKYYQSIDREVYRLYYPNKYNFYETEIQKIVAEYFDEFNSIKESLFGVKSISEDQGDMLNSQFNILQRKLNNPEVANKINNAPNYNKWCQLNGLQPYSPVCYDDWVKDKGVILDEEKVEIFEGFNVKKTETPIYNPNRFRYDEDDEEENINSNKKR